MPTRAAIAATLQRHMPWKFRRGRGNHACGRGARGTSAGRCMARTSHRRSARSSDPCTSAHPVLTSSFLSVLISGHLFSSLDQWLSVVISAHRCPRACATSGSPATQAMQVTTFLASTVVETHWPAPRSHRRVEVSRAPEHSACTPLAEGASPAAAMAVIRPSCREGRRPQRRSLSSRAGWCSLAPRRRRRPLPAPRPRNSPPSRGRATPAPPARRASPSARRPGPRRSSASFPGLRPGPPRSLARRRRAPLRTCKAHTRRLAALRCPGHRFCSRPPVNLLAPVNLLPDLRPIVMT